MEQEQMARMICELRKEKGLTQRQLADQLNVTDKAVSKWERGLGYPDITLLPALAAALGVSPGELLNGRRDGEAPPREETELVESTIQYAEKVTASRSKTVLSVAMSVFTILCLIAIAVCLIVDVAMNRSLTWSPIPIGAVVYAWCVLVPLLLAKRNRVLYSLLALSALTPVLFVYLEGQLRIGMVPLALSLTAISLVFLWLVYLLFRSRRINNWFAGAATLLLVILLNLGIDAFMSLFLQQSDTNIWDLISSMLMIVLAAVFFLFGLRKRRARAR